MKQSKYIVNKATKAARAIGGQAPCLIEIIVNEYTKHISWSNNKYALKENRREYAELASKWLQLLRVFVTTGQIHFSE